MAAYFAPTGSSSVSTYRWVPNVAEGDSIASALVLFVSGNSSLSSYEVDGDAVSFTISDGHNGTVSQFVGTAYTANGDTIVEQLYVPCIDAVNLAATGQDIADYVLRKVNGLGETADADQVNDVLERITDMLAAWRSQGFDVGVPLPVTTTTVFVCDDAFIPGIKANAIVACADLYAAELSPVVVNQARRGEQLIKSRLLDTRTNSAVHY